MTRRDAAVAAALAVIAACMVYAATRALHGVNVPSGAWWFAAGALVSARVSFKAGQYARGYGHARGIRRSHWAAIGGRKH